MSNATWVISACLLVCDANGGAPSGGVVQLVPEMGRLALTHYVGHVLLGIVPLMVVMNERQDMSFEGAFAAAMVYLAFTAVLGHFWLRHHAQGPLEWALRLAASRPIRE